jgi:hypothetical protein
MLARKGTVKQMTSYFKTPGAGLHGQEKIAFGELCYGTVVFYRASDRY